MFKRLSPAFKGILLSLMAFTCFSISDTGTKWLSEHYPIYLIVGIENVFSLLLLMTLAAWQGGIQTLFNRETYKDWRVHLLRGVMNFLINIAVVYCFTKVSLSSLYTAAFLIPIVATILAIPMYKERAGLHRWLALIAGFVGVLIAFQPWSNPLALSPLTMLALASIPVTVAIMHLVAKSYRYANPNAMAFWPILISLVPMSVLAILYAAPIDPWHLPLLIFCGSVVAIAIALLAMAFKIGKSSSVSGMQYIQMLWGVIFGYAAFGDTPDLHMLAGAVIIIASGIYLIMQERKTAIPVASPNTPAAS